MEAELIRENIITSYPSANLNLTVLAEGEAIVPDTKKDISEIISVEGRSFIEKTEIQKGRIIFTGTAEFTVLYNAENSEEICSLNTKIPFNHIEECSSVTGDDKFAVRPETIHSECLLLNSRKISLKSAISVNFISYIDITLPVVSDIRCAELEIRKEQAAFSSLCASLEECFTVSDILSVPASSPPVASLLLSRVSVNDCSVKAVTGKAVAKGTLSVFRLYLTPEGTIAHMQHDIPFTEIIDVPSLTDDAVYNTDFYVKKYTITEDTQSSDEQIFSLSADICLNATVFSTTNAYVVTDAYIPGKEIKLLKSSNRKSELLFCESRALTLKSTFDLPSDFPPMEQVCPLNARVTSLESVYENGKITVNGTADVAITYLSSGGKNITTLTHEIKFSDVIDCPSDNPTVYKKASVSHIDFNFINQAKIDLRCIVNLSLCVSESTTSFSGIDSLVIDDAPIEKRPSIIIYFVKSGDTLWDIAKRYSTTVDKIITANALEKDDILNIGMRLLIPA